jgi:hypothetical protein
VSIGSAVTGSEYNGRLAMTANCTHGEMKNPTYKRNGRPTFHRDLTVSWAYKVSVSFKKDKGMVPRYSWKRTAPELVKPIVFDNLSKAEKKKFKRALKELIRERRQLEMFDG